MSGTTQQYISMHQLKSVLSEANNLSVEMIEESNPLVVKRVGSEVVGICGVRRTELANTLYLYVKGQYRGRGYGKELVREVVRQARDCKIDGIVLLVRIDNKPAIHIYKINGFKRLYPFKLPGAWCWRMFLPLSKKGYLVPLKLVAIDFVYYLKCIRGLERVISHLTKHVKPLLRRCCL